MIYEITGFIALLMIGTGIGIEFGVPYALMASGSMLLVMSLIGAKNSEK